MSNIAFINLHTTEKVEHFIPSTPEACQVLVPHLDALDQFPSVITKRIEEVMHWDDLGCGSDNEGIAALSIDDNGRLQLGFEGSLIHGDGTDWQKLSPYLEGLPQQISRVKAAIIQRAAGGAQ